MKTSINHQLIFFPGRLCWLHHRPSIIYPSTGGRAPACDRCHGCVCPASTKSGRIWSSSFSSAGYIYGYIYGHISIANMIISIYVFSFPDLPPTHKIVCCQLAPKRRAREHERLEERGEVHNRGRAIEFCATNVT